MIRIEFPEPTSAAWKRWRALCEAARRELIQANLSGEPLVITELYKKQRAVLLGGKAPFFGKCAYCEARVQIDQFGDVEHYRPKAGLRDEDNSLVMIVGRDGARIPHPGYFWLAYEWTNLLPSCTRCNVVTGTRRRGPMFGKGNRFPVRGQRATLPDEEALEEPVLLNPVIDEPAEHMTVDSTGVVAPLNGSDRGDQTIKMLGLNEFGRPDERAREYGRIRNQFSVLMLRAYTEGRVPAEFSELVAVVKRGDVAFAMASRRALRDAYSVHQQIGTELTSS